MIPLAAGMLGKEAIGRLGAGIMGRYAAMNPMAKRAMWGGIAGAGYGMFSDNTSILGGAALGAGLAGPGYRLGRAGYRAGMAAFRGGGGAGAIASAALAGMGASSKGMFGSAYNQAINGFSAMGSAARRWAWRM